MKKENTKDHLRIYIKRRKKEIYQVVYCDSKFWATKNLQEQIEINFRWYLLECPLIGIKDLRTARERAKKEIKNRFGERAQVIIIGEVEGQFKGITADDLLGIIVLRGANATECPASEIIFSKKSKQPIFYNRSEDLRYG